MTGKVKFESDLFDANEWIKSTPSVSNDKNLGKAPIDDTKNAAHPFDRFNFTVDGKINRLLYENYDIRNTVAAGNFTPDKFSVSNFQTKIGNSDIGGKGDLVGVFDWLFDNKTLGGQLLLTSNYMDLNQFMTEKPQTNVAVNTATEPIAVPKNVDVMVFADMKRVLYTNMDLTNVKGKLAIQNQEVKIVDGEANVFGGKTEIDGGYNTQDPAKPKFKLAFDVKDVDFKQSFTTLNTFQKLAPIGQFISGKFNTSFEMNGALGKDLSPDLSSLTMSGFFQTIQGFLSGLKPLEEISNKLNISELKNLDLKETKNWFEVNNGTVEVKEFTKNIKDIALKIKGTHSLTNEMNYSISTKIPRKKLEANAVGAAAGAGFNVLVSEASKLGINIKNSEFVNVLFSITGSMKSPKIGMKVLGGDGETSLADAAKGAANAVITKAKDSVMTRANQELDKAKSKAKELADKALDSAKNVVTNKVNEVKDQAVEKAKTEATKVLEKEVGDKVGQKVGDEIDKQIGKTEAGDKVKKEADKLKEKLNKWDPFKKKDPPPPPPNNNGNQ
jgi:AsmA-like C-terminal region